MPSLIVGGTTSPVASANSRYCWLVTVVAAHRKSIDVNLVHRILIGTSSLTAHPKFSGRNLDKIHGDGHAAVACPRVVQRGFHCLIVQGIKEADSSTNVGLPMALPGTHYLHGAARLGAVSPVAMISQRIATSTLQRDGL